MTFWEVMLLVSGFACLSISFFIARSRGTSEGEYEDSRSSSAVWTEREEQMIRSRVTKLMEEQQTDFIERTTEELNHLCNDKIIAMDEFSRPLLEKIESNHQDVVFMYNMLNEKEKEIKKILTKSVVREEKKPEVNEVKKEQPEKISAQPAPVQKAPDQPPQKFQTSQKPPLQKTPVQKAPVQKIPVQPKPVQPVPAKPLKGQETAGRTTQKKAVEKRAQTQKAMPDGRSVDVNALIQKMYKEGKSIMEISKALNIGQGEVKLVITLYGGRGR